MTWVTLSIGSNTQARENFSSCLDSLLLRFNELTLSSVYESTSDDASGACYLNMAAGFETGIPLNELVSLLKQIEDKHKRSRTPPFNAEVTLDLDLLTYGAKAGTFEQVVLPHPDIVTKAYVLWPLSQVAGKFRHPVLNLTISELNKELLPQFKQAGQCIKPVAFEWHGRVLSTPS